MMEAMYEWQLILYGTLATTVTGLASGVGAMPVLVFRNVSDKLLDTLLGFAAGVMLAATVFSLLVPAINLGGVWITSLGIVLGALFLAYADRVVPHFHFIEGAEGPPSALRRIWLLILAVTLHNFPEGLAVGVGFGSGEFSTALTLAIAIGLQNMPEGLAIALPLVREGYSPYRSLVYAAFSGLAEPLAGFLGAAAVALAKPLVPVTMGFAAGAMLYVISEEIIPETHRKGYARIGTTGLLAGFIIMMVLDNLFH
ncbi:MAG: ZIP family metal transporter [Anaerolineae bacterium]|nr:ZIP family metal transporter [Anaerolineae bacterium]MDW8102722.1 ZIP family metal transporter [Anaerolineae bacterium]